MALPEDEVAAAKRALPIDDAAEFLRLHVGIAGGEMAGGLERWAQEGRPLEPEDGTVAPH